MTAAASTTGSAFALALRRANNGSYSASGTVGSPLLDPSRPVTTCSMWNGTPSQRSRTAAFCPAFNAGVQRDDQLIGLLVSQRRKIEYLHRLVVR